MQAPDDGHGLQWLVLDDGAVVGVGHPVGRDDIAGHQLLAGLVGDAQRVGALERAVGVDPPDGSPRLVHRLPVAGVVLHDVHLHHVAVLVLELDQHRQVHGVGPVLDDEVDRQPGEVARHPAAAERYMGLIFRERSRDRIVKCVRNGGGAAAASGGLRTS